MQQQRSAAGFSHHAWVYFRGSFSALTIPSFASERQEVVRPSLYFRRLGLAPPSASSAAVAAAALAGNQLLVAEPEGSKQKAVPADWAAELASLDGVCSSPWEVSASFKHSAVITPRGGGLITLVLM